MKINLFWLVPVVFPFGLVAVMRGVVWFTGATWQADAALFVTALCSGFVSVMSFAALLSGDAPDWTIHIGGRK